MQIHLAVRFMGIHLMLNGIHLTVFTKRLMMIYSLCVESRASKLWPQYDPRIERPHLAYYLTDLAASVAMRSVRGRPAMKSQASSGLKNVFSTSGKRRVNLKSLKGIRVLRPKRHHCHPIQSRINSCAALRVLDRLVCQWCVAVKRSDGTSCTECAGWNNGNSHRRVGSKRMSSESNL